MIENAFVSTAFVKLILRRKTIITDFQSERSEHVLRTMKTESSTVKFIRIHYLNGERVQ